MKIRIAKKATKGKGKTWKRGESSTTNAETKKYRSKINLFASMPIVHNENLTAANLLSLQSDISDAKPDDSMSFKSGNTFASIYTNCSNISFNRFLDIFDSSSPHHREMVAVLATATELIKEQNGQETDTEYFAVLMSLLESCDREETLTATITLLYMVIKRLPVPVIRLKFSDICDSLIKVLEKYHSTPNSYLTSNLIKCLSHLLKKQEMAVWQMSSTQRICDILLTFTLHAKPRIRRSAKKSIVSILKGSSIVWEKDTPVLHLFTPTVIKFIIKKIRETNISENVNNVLYMLNLLSELIGIVPQALLKTCCETLLGLISLGSGLMMNSLRVFISLFSSTSPLRELTADMNISLIRALNDHQPSFNDVDSLSIWINVIKQAHLSLFLIKPDSCFVLLPMAFSTITQCWQSDSKVLHITVNTSLEELIREVLTPSIDVILPDTMVAIMETFENSLSFKYQNAWPSVLSIIGKLFQYLGPKNPTLVSSFLRTLSNLREGFDLNLVPEIDKSIGMAIKNMGPEPLLIAIPLEVDMVTNFRNSWIIPLLRDYIENTKLAHFINYFVPLAKSIEKNIALFTKQQDLIKVKLSQVLFDQIWSLLPSFCRKPIDLIESFTSNFAKMIGAKITDDKRLRIHCLSALRTLIRKCTSKEEVNHLSRFAKNYLPLLFNVYTCKTDDASDKLPVLETIQIYLEITEPKIRIENYEAIKRNLQKFEEDIQLRHLLLDLMRLFVPYLSSSELKELFFSKFVVNGISDKSDRRRQKKSYRIIEMICKNETSTEFFQKMDQNIIAMLIDFVNASSGEARSAPIRALSSLLMNDVIMKTIDLEEYLEPLLASIIDCMKQTSSRTKLSTMFLLNILCQKLNNGYSTLLQRFLDLYNNAENIDKPVVLTCISNIIIRFREKIEEKTKTSLFYQFISLGETQDRALIKSMLYFINEWIKPMDKIELMKCTNDIIVSITSIDEETRKPFRNKIRDILCKIARKIGFEVVSNMVPDEYYKVIRNLKKLEARKTKEKSNAPSESTAWTKDHHSKTIKDILDSSSDSENELEENISKLSAKSKARTWIEEEEDEILDLTEPNVTRKLYSSDMNRLNMKKESKEDEFKMDKNGKLIIEPINFKTKRKREETDNDTKDSFEDLKETKSMTSKVTSSKNASTKSYKPGGKGIHRSLKKKKNDLKGLKTGEEYRSKKARGDVKKKGRPDPYAYIPLNQGILSKRKKAKYQTHFKNIIGAAKEGAMRGAKKRNKTKK